MRVLLKISLGVLVMATISCARKNSSEDTSNLQIRAPDFFGKAQSSSVSIPANRKACYGVILSGPGIGDSAAAPACAPKLGLLAGYVGAGQILELAAVPRGSGRKVELYLFLQQLGQDLPCPEIGAHFNPANNPNIYLIGTAENVSIEKDSETVEIRYEFPGVANNVAVQSGMPASCAVASNPGGSGGGASKGFTVSAGVQEAHGAAHSLRATLGKASEQRVLGGANYKIFVK